MVYLNRFSLGMGRDPPCTVPSVPGLVGSPWCQSASGPVLPTTMPLGHRRAARPDASASESGTVFLLRVCSDRWVSNTTRMEGFCQWYLHGEPGSPGTPSGLLASPRSACLLCSEHPQAEVSMEGVRPPCPPPAKLPKSPHSHRTHQGASVPGSGSPAAPRGSPRAGGGRAAALLPRPRCGVFTLHLRRQEQGIRWGVQVKMDCHPPPAVSMELISACVCLWQD